MLSADDTWPLWLILPGTFISVIISHLDVSVNLKIVSLLTFIWNIHFRLYPTFIDEKEDKASKSGKHPLIPLDYPNRNLWNVLSLILTSELLRITLYDIVNDWNTLGAKGTVQGLISLVAGLVGVSFFFDFLFGWIFKKRLTVFKFN